MFSDNSHRSKSEPVINIGDPNDIAIRVGILNIIKSLFYHFVSALMRFFFILHVLKIR